MTHPHSESAPARDANRPFWSVMIPTHEPRGDYLEQALASVTDALGSRDDVQIELVDDASAGFDPHAFLAGFGRPGIGWHRNPEPRGLPGNWNECVARARGRWVHILHQDDFVLEGFYPALRELVARTPEAGAAFCDTWWVGPGERRRRFTTVPATQSGVLEDWPQHVFVRLAIQTPAIVVRRDVYEALGGFDESLSYVPDWDLWKRLAVHYPILYEPRALACYRSHRRSQSARLRHSGRNVVELARSIDRSAQLLPAAVAAGVTRRARRHYALYAVESACESLFREASPAAARAQLAEAVRAWSLPEIAGAVVWVALRFALRPVWRAATAPTRRAASRAR